MTSIDSERYGRHLREVVNAVRASPLSEHRSQCRCDRCMTPAAALLGSLAGTRTGPNKTR